MPDEYTESSVPEEQIPNPNNEDQESKVPDWLQEAGWEESSGTVDESKPVFDDLEGEDEIVPAEIPAWLEDAAPEGYSFDIDSESDPSDSPDLGKAIIDNDLIPISPQEELSEEKPIDSDQAAESPLEEKEEPIPDVPTWLENLELDEDSQETAIAWLENMPESLRASADEVLPTLETEAEMEQPPTDLPSQLSEEAESKVPDAELSEDLVASELLPEEQTVDTIFGQDEIDETDNDLPSWLQELGEDGETPLAAPQSPEKISTIPEPAPERGDQEIIQATQSEGDSSLMPDWLSDFETEDESITSSEDEVLTPVKEEAEIPDWLGDFEDAQKITDEEAGSDSLAWLESLAEDEKPEEEFITSSDELPQVPEEISPPVPGEARIQDVSPSDDTLNTEYPEWLSLIGEKEADADQAPLPKESVSETEPEDSSWIDQIEETPYLDTPESSTPEEDSEVLDWLEGMDTQTETRPDIDEKTVDAPSETPIDTSAAEDMPGWLEELETADQDPVASLESAIRQTDRPLSDEEKEYLDRVEEKQDENADWLAKLDMIDDQTPSEKDTPAIKVAIPDEEPESVQPEEAGVSGGVLDRLKESDEVEEIETEIPQWLENLKREEDPQETAILWLKQFVAQGDNANLSEEIKRYTDELDPGDTVPKWMEDLKHEEDPQTTAMLWLEQLSDEREETPRLKVRKEEPDESDWLAELEKEVAEQSQETVEDPKDFPDVSEGWLADLELDEKLKTGDEEAVSDWSQDQEGVEEGEETPPWDKATSPLEGDFHTDELAGEAEKEVEIPEWLAGYTEDELEDAKIEAETSDIDSTAEPDETAKEQDEYTWVPAGDEQPVTTREPIDLNKAAISQLESILGISHQIAQGIVKYREKQGFYQAMEDLLNVPEIKDEQTIEILKPEVFIKPISEEVKPVEETKEKPKTAPVVEEAPETRLAKARSLLADSDIEEALEHYAYLILKKKTLQEVVEDLTQASIDHPVDVTIMKTLGDAYMRLDKLDDALEAYSKAEDLLR